MSSSKTVKQDERRLEPRYPGVGIRLLYSPADDKVLEDLAQVLYHATMVDLSLSGLAFDIKEPLEKGEQLVVLVHGVNDKPNERLMTEVCWQIRLGKDFFRVGTRILSSEILQDETEFEKIDDIQRGMDFPAGVAMPCPACHGDAMFNLSGLQPLSAGPTGCIPLYDCSHCGTTRTITSLLAYHRQVKAAQSD